MGVPQGVPDEFKAGNQIAAGFQSALFWWSTVNKNVDWISRDLSTTLEMPSGESRAMRCHKPNGMAD
jgi:hypothetical protein